jgi:hypothetical protein
MEKAARSNPIRRTGSIVRTVLLLVPFLLAGCGIKSYPYLAAPENISEPLENEQLFSFINYTENNTNYFLGYEIYYKFYSADTAVSKYESERDQLELTPTYEKLTSFGYTRMYNKIDVFSRPLIPVSTELAGQAVSISIDFRFLTETIFPEISYAENTIEGARYIRDTDDIQDTVYNFNPGNISSDFSDIPSAIMSSDVNMLYLSLYVLSYGKYDVFNELHSSAAHLGKITVQTENAIF